MVGSRAMRAWWPAAVFSVACAAAEAQAPDAYLAFNQALARTAKQMRRAKRAVREDKPVREDKDSALREGLRRIPD